jgi:hypothetical protein
MDIKKDKPVVPKIVGEIVTRNFRKGISVVQVKNGAQWVSYELHDSNVVYCEVEFPKPGAVVRFRPSPLPKKYTMLPFAYQAEVYETIEAMWRKNADNAATEEKLIDDAVSAFAEVAGVVVHRTDGIRTNSTVPAVSATDTSDEVSS